MPEHPDPKDRPHPFRLDPPRAGHTHSPGVGEAAYAELAVTSNFSFLRGASHPEELVECAAALGHTAIAITDRHTLAGVVRAHVAAKRLGLHLLPGTRLDLDAGEHTLMVLVYPTDHAAYGRMCRLLTVGKRRAEKGHCDLSLHDLFEHQEGLQAVVLPPAVLDQPLLESLLGLRSVFDDDRLSIAATRLYGPDDESRLRQLRAVSEYVEVPLVATNDVHYHHPDRRDLQDVVTCIRLGCTVHEAGRRLHAHAERHLKCPQEMARLFAQLPEAIPRTVEIAQRCHFNLDELRYQYPDEICPPGRTPMTHLTDLTWRGARDRYPAPGGIPRRVRRKIEYELALIEELDYPRYFLTVHDLVCFARKRDILCQGRGAAANSAVCYCLGVTSVDPDRIDLLFERFVSRERKEPPDIDIDFEHERREEVIQYIYGKYGRHRAALTAEVITYRGKSAIREVGKTLGLSLDCVDRLAGSLDWWDDGRIQADRLREIGLNPDDRTLRHLFRLVESLKGFPRHLSQHVGGFVITRDPLSELVPIENAAMPDRTVIEWDKDDIDAMGMLKVDCLGLGMLTCIRKCFEMIERDPPLTLANVPAEDEGVYDMICRADTVGVFQIESRAQMSMLPRLRPRSFYDLVIEVAIVRPGPIQGNMVHPYLRRRNGEEPVSYPDDAVKEVLAKTLGVPLFQEQAMKLAIVAAGFSPDEADQLRRAMAAWKRKGDQIEHFGRQLIGGMISRGYPREFAHRCFEQIKGFSEYGFPESHAASFALLVYVSAWLKKYHPAAFAAALINSQPMGFYAPAQIVRDAREHGVEVRPVDVNRSLWDCTLERGDDDARTLRLGMRLVKGLRQDEADRVHAMVAAHGPFDDVETLWRCCDVRVATLRALASADAFGTMGLDRQRARWAVDVLRDECLPLFDQATTLNTDTDDDDGGSLLPAVAEPVKVVQDYAATGLSLKAHPLSFIRESLAARGVVEAAELRDERNRPHGTHLSVAGVVLVRQRPGTASGIVFITLEDETGVANLIVRPKIYQRDRAAARHGVVLIARGKVERQGEVVHVLVENLETADVELSDLATRVRNFS